MKLIYLTNIQTPAKGAQSIQIREMAEAFGKILGDNFIFISPKNHLNKKVFTSFSWIKLRVGKRMPRFLRYFLVILKSFPTVINNKPDYIFSRDIGIIFIYKLLGFKVCYEIHKPFETKIGHFLFKLVHKKVKVIAISRALRNEIIRKYHLNKNNIFVVHDGVFINRFTQIKKKKTELRKKYLSISKNKFVIMYSGSLIKGKGLDLILKASKKLKKFMFVIIGAKQKEVGQNIIFIPRKNHEELPYYLKCANLLILPITKKLSYWRYTSPLKLFEYMAAEVPILASNIESIKEILNRNNSFLFNPGEINDFIRKVEFIKENYQTARKKAKRAFYDVQKYSWDKRAGKIINFLKNN